jgi:cohesin domain-containing protein
MRRPPRIAVLIVLLAGAAAWVAIDLRGPAAPTSVKAPAPGASQDPEHAAAPASEAKQPGIPSRLTLGKFGVDPFSSQSWLPRRKPAVVSEPPAVVVPPLPYRFAGQFHRESGVEVYVARGEEIFPVKEGDTLDGLYKIDSVSATEVSFVHLPSGTRQTIQFSALKDQELTAQGGLPPPRAPASAPASSPPLSPVAKLIPVPTPGASSSDNSIPSKAAPAQLRWDGPTSARAGASFDVSLRVTSGERIRAAPMQVRFDPAVLESVSVRPGRYFSAEKTGSFGYRVNSDGSIFIGVSNRTPTPASDAEMLVLTFKSIKAADAAEISVASLNLQGAAGRAIAYNGLSPFRTTITP